MKISRSYYGRKPSTKRLDLSAIKEVLKDTRCWACLGIVVKDQEGSHFEQDGNDILVELAIMPTGERITARLAGGVAGSRGGLWSIPNEGTEVAVLIPEGELEFSPLIVGTLSTGSVPAGVDGDSVLLTHDVLATVEASMVKLGLGASEPLLKGNAFNTAMTTYITALTAAINALSAALVPPNPGIGSTHATAATTFLNQLTTSLSTKVTTE